MSDLSYSPDTLDGFCLAEEVIHALACGGLEEAQRSKALAHLDDCELCQALLADEVHDLPPSGSADDPGLPTLIQIDALVAGRYRIERFVARGGMGEVYEAWDELLAERVALKTINPLVASADQARASARFRQEVQLSRRVADPHVCRIYEFGQHLVRGFGALSYLTMELIEGETLGARLRRGPRLGLVEVVDLGTQMLLGLGAAHAVGVLHRDFKSDNVMLRQSSRATGPHAVIMDFGLARLLGDQSHRFTERHELVGSAAYMAPEQLEEGATLSEATDIYAFGVVLFEMLTGHLPFEGSSPVAVALRRLSHAAPPPSTLVPELPGGWDALVARCLQRDPSRRIASTRELAAALDAVAHEPPGSQRRRRPTRRQLGLAVAAGAALLGGVSHFSSRGRAEAERALDATALSLEPAAAEPPAPSALAAPAGEPALEPARPDPVEPSVAPPGEASPNSLAANSPAADSPAADSPAADSPEASQLPSGTPAPALPAAPAAARAVPPPRRAPAASAPAQPIHAEAPAQPLHTEAPPQPLHTEAPRAPEDVRDLFFLEAPNDRRAQNSER